LRVLVADDNADAADSLAFLARLRGHTAEVALDGQSALDKAREFEPHVLLLDIAMPRLDGYEVARRLERRTSPFPFVVAVTALGQKEDRAAAAEAGIDLHLLKPTDPRQLLALLERLGRFVCEE